MKTPIRTSDEPALPQLQMRGIIGVWAAAAIPMALLAWVFAPVLADQMTGPSALPRALIITLTAGLVWQFVLVMGLVAREQGSLSWPVLKDALWLHAPRSPQTGRRGGRLWFVVVPLIVAGGGRGGPFPAWESPGAAISASSWVQIRGTRSWTERGDGSR